MKILPLRCHGQSNDTEMIYLYFAFHMLVTTNLILKPFHGFTNLCLRENSSLLCHCEFLLQFISNHRTYNSAFFHHPNIIESKQCITNTWQKSMLVPSIVVERKYSTYSGCV